MYAVRTMPGASMTASQGRRRCVPATNQHARRAHTANRTTLTSKKRTYPGTSGVSTTWVRTAARVMKAPVSTGYSSGSQSPLSTYGRAPAAKPLPSYNGAMSV